MESRTITCGLAGSGKLPRRAVGARRAAAALVCLAALVLGACDLAGEPGSGVSAPVAATAPAAPQASHTEAPLDGPAGSAPASAAAFRGVEARSAADYLAEPRYANADARRGELLTYACKACHALAPDEKNDLGPSLRGVIGRRAATLEGFEYSEALAGSGVVWTPEAIETWLADPAAFAPGTKMKFTGYQSAADRRDVVAYLLRRAAGRDAPEP